MEAQAWLAALERTGVAAAVRTSPWLYPAVEIAHLAGIALLVGGAALFDLRLLGLGRALPVGALGGHLLRWSRRSLALVVPSGALLFAAHAVELSRNPAFRLKLLLLAAAGVNALVFHAVTARGMAAWDAGGGAPRAARAAACVSLLCWLAVIACGRLIAYV